MSYPFFSFKILNAGSVINEVKLGRKIVEGRGQDFLRELCVGGDFFKIFFEFDGVLETKPRDLSFFNFLDEIFFNQTGKNVVGCWSLETGFLCD